MAGYDGGARCQRFWQTESNLWQKDVAEDLNGRVSVIVCSDDAAIGLESTVVDALGEEPIILRPGGVTLEMIQSLLGKGRYDEKLNEKLGAEDKPKSPGMKYTHYAPKAKVRRVRWLLRKR